ncbi:MAG TPA: ImcF-related family protein [Acidobacteriaceae bacterium]|nr:ImcF-related family protein [Acidobacteriaceae bacterium]
MLVYLLVVLVVIVAAALAFGLAALLHLQGSAAIIFISLILLAGIAAAVVILVLHFRAKKNREQEGDAAIGGATGELDILLNDANRKLRESQQGAKSLDGVPLIYILGEAGTAKTTAVIRSGLDPELVAGTAPVDGQSVPTPVINLWFTKLAALVEVGASVRQNNAQMTRLVERTRAKAYRSAFGTGAAARAAIVCVSIEQLLATDGGASLMASARSTSAQLREISRLLGTPLPVYVIVTKLDRVPHFEEYVRNLSNVEVRQILGSALAKSEASAGVYADQAARNLATVLDGLAYKLGEFRVEMLDRETEPANTSGVYEFPREFGKLRKNLNQYLVELCKPSQLSANPYLRGFYFTGIRAQLVERAATAPAATEERIPQDAGATQYLNISMGRAQAPGRPAPPPTMVSTRVPQWAFLPRLLPEIILGDKSALTATQQTAPARLFRRILFGTLALLFAVYTVLLLISFFNNLGIEHRIQNAAKALPVTAATSISLPSLSDLQNLDQLRQVILQLDDYHQNGAPWSYRFGLYQGDKLAERARRVYFDRFRPMMLNPAQTNFVSYMKALPDTPAATSDSSSYLSAYNPLKAYLITTSNPDKSTAKFLTPVFVQYWIGSRQIDGDQQQLAQKQSDFYSSELVRQPPYAITPDTMVVSHTRSYLSHFLAQTRVYQAMLNDADKTSPSIDFNKQYPGSAASVVDGHVVRGAFTKTGFAFMQNALKHPEGYLQGEVWVLGDQAGESLNTASVAKDLAGQYSTDFINEWHLFLADARVVSCGNLHEAPTRLNALAGGDSPLLALFYTISHNTAVDDPQIKGIFQPAQVLVDPNANNRFIGPGNTAYVNALLGIYSAVSQVASIVPAPTDPALYAPIVQAASAADVATQQTAQAFNIDAKMQTDKEVRALMEAPIQCAAKLPPSPGAAVNGAGAKLCGAMNPVLAKFPFNPNATTMATLPEVNAVFAPETGAIWAIFNGTFKPFFVQQGGQYIPAPNAPQPPSPKFAQFFSKAASLSLKLYPPGSQNPTFSFTPRFLPSKGITTASIQVDGQKIPNGSSYTWNSVTAHQATVFYDQSQGGEFQGTWALFQLAKVGQPTKSPAGVHLDFPIVTTFAGQKVDPSSAGKVVSFEITGPGAELFLPGYVSGLSCVSTVVKP